MTVSGAKHVAIIGGGIGGLATAFFLGAEEDVEVTLFEREPRHNAHSSGRSAEILRTAIDDPVTEALALATARILHDPTSVGLSATADLADHRGLFVLTEADQDSPWIERHLSAGAARESSRKELHRVAPHFAPHGKRILHLAAGGRIHGDRLLAALARGALRRGVRIQRSTGDAVPRTVDGRIVGVELDGGCAPFDAVLVAAGAWSGPIGEAMGAPLPLRTTRRHMWVTSPDPQAPVDAPIVWDDATGFYVRPDTGQHGATGWAFSATDLDEHRAGSDQEGRRAAYAVAETVKAQALAAAREHLPRVNLTGLRGWRGFRDLSPDDRPIIGADPRVLGLHWCAGLGGHGMTMSMAVGRLAADAVMERRDTLGSQCKVGRFLGVASRPS